ncbi:hypothetical protein J4E91_001617 [Alternaria rosae]|nr:hypothetical protein J4E91_001617 [Alternaria rosae]
MAVVKTRRAARKSARKRVHFGRHMINVQVGPDEVPFTVHEDLLCTSSGYFKKELQSSRKVIEGECSICTEGMLDHSPITFCGDCGQNFHTKCIQDWLDREETCPLCRLDWAFDENPARIDDFTLEECDPLSFDIYMQWLYTGIITSYPHGDVENDVQRSFTQLIRAHIVGDSLQDARFLKALREEMIDHNLASNRLPGREGVVYAYDNASRTSKLWKFLAHLYAARASRNSPSYEHYPTQFIHEVLQALLGRCRRERGENLKNSLADWLSGEEAEEVEEAEEDQQGEGQEADQE